MILHVGNSEDYTHTQTQKMVRVNKKKDEIKKIILFTIASREKKT